MAAGIVDGRRMSRLDDKRSRRFVWVAGIRATAPITVIGAILSRGSPGSRGSSRPGAAGLGE
jgi:hypothetical protein